MNNLDKLVESFFKPQSKWNKELTISELLNLVKDVESILPMLKEGPKIASSTPIEPYRVEKASDQAQETKEMVIKIPVIKITERWGKLREGTGGQDREIIETFTKNIGGASVEEKLANVQKLIVEFDPNANIPKILSTIVFLELLRSIVQEYTEAVSGFLFEGFLAGIFGGQSVQITDVSTEEGEGQKGKPITDVVLNGKLYSLKLLSESTTIHGSFENMVEHMAQSGQIIYLIVRKSRDQDTLQFSEFEITLNNFLQYIGFGEEVFAKKNREAIKLTGAEIKKFVAVQEDVVILSIRIPNSRKVYVKEHGQDSTLNVDILKDEQDYDVFYIKSKLKLSGAALKLYGDQETYEKILNLQKAENKDELIAVLRESPGYKNREQWSIPPGYAAKNSKIVGTLDLSRETINGVAIQYAELLQNNLIPIYTKLDEVGTAVNNYFLGVSSEETTNKQYATVAAAKSKELAAETDKVAK